MFLIIALVVALYWRTLNYNYVIDDNVLRDGYGYDVPLTPPPYSFYCTKPSPWYRMFMIAMHCVNVAVIYMLWGWGPALLFAVHPMSAWGVCWVTGNYYATAAYFTLISYFFIHQFPGILGAAIAMPFFAAALNSTVCPINFPFMAIVNPWIAALFIPLGFFLGGKRFQTNLKIRLGLRSGKSIVDYKPTFRRLFLMVKVVARYTYDSICPDKIGFFGPMGNNMRDDQKVYDKMHSADQEFWVGLLLILSVLALGLLVSPVGVLWFFVIISLHSQWNLTGQFYAQRYLYLPLIGLCVVAGTLLQPFPVLMTAVVTFLVIRTYLYIPAWKNQGCVLRNDMENYPESAQVYNNYAQWMMAPGGSLNNVQLNELAMHLFRSEKMDPAAWENQMNIAAFFASINQWQEARRRTEVAIGILEPLGGIPGPLAALKQQLINIDKVLEEQKAANLAALTGAS